MHRILIIVCILFAFGCSPDSDGDATKKGGGNEIEDGGDVPNPDRDTAREFFGKLSNVQSAEEEKQVVTEFADWLKANDYKIEVEQDGDKYMLSCPYFPPVTPWTEHTFHDVENLKILPQ